MASSAFRAHGPDPISHPVIWKKMRADPAGPLTSFSGSQRRAWIGIPTSGQHGIHILAELVMRGVLCLGAREGRQPTFVLLDEWIPASRVLERDEALGEPACRYFASHGPATVGDFAWWSGLLLGDARRGLEVAGKSLVEQAAAPTAYWMASAERAPGTATGPITVGPPRSGSGRGTLRRLLRDHGVSS